jgi:predicted ester cyclase
VTHNPLPGQPPGREGQKQTITAVRAALPDIRSTIDDLIAEGDKVVWRWTARATHQGPLMGIPPTGKQITFGGIVIDRIASGQIVERWDQTDTLGLLQQLGAIPS